MEQQEERIKRFLETFWKATQIQALYFDRCMKVTACRCGEQAYQDLFTIGMGRLGGFLEEILEKGSDKSFYTYYIDHNLVCNITVLGDAGVLYGVVVTQPIALNAPQKADIEAGLGGLAQTAAGCNEYVSALLRAPVVSYDRLAPLGEVLGSLSRAVLGEAGFHQVVCGGKADSDVYQLFQPGKLLYQKHEPLFDKAHSDYSTYFKLKNAVSKGDMAALAEALRAIKDENLQMGEHAPQDSIRSIKNRLIEGCAMCSFFAIEAGASYSKTRDFTDQIIRELEDTESIDNMYALMKSALKTLTRYVAATRITGYSKPVRLAVEYIEKHYAEKITLKTLAQRANLSEFYLSGLMKKETGLHIADLINKVRVEESKKILLKSAVSIRELAAMVGYNYSNHYARVFKQHTGMTPSAFAKMMAASSAEESNAKDILRMLLDQLCHAISLFPGILDIGRVVDPVSNAAWMVQPSGKIIEGTCYDFWNRTRACDTCILRMALEQNRSFTKLEQGGEGSVLVFAAPVTIGGKRYGVEFVKNIGENYFDCTAAHPPAKPD